jgi:cbb3-type cytochrome oxidase maturation protein
MVLLNSLHQSHLFEINLLEILYILIPLSIFLVTMAILVFSWAVKTGQFDDLEGPAHSILFDDDNDMIPKEAKADNTDLKKDPHG